MISRQEGWPYVAIGALVGVFIDGWLGALLCAVGGLFVATIIGGARDS